MASDRRRDRPAGERLGDRPDFADWMRDIDDALESRARPALDERSGAKPRRRGWFLRAKSLSGILLHR